MFPLGISMFAFLPIISLIKSADKAEEIYGLRGITSLFFIFFLL